MTFMLRPGGRRTCCALLVFALALTVPETQLSAAQTWFVRVDGGDAVQCTGRSDAPYPGNGSAQACAFKHPFFAVPPGGPARIAGGDTLLVGPGSYMMGLGASGASSCSPAASWDCFMSAIPSGPSPAQPTRVLGAGHAANCPAAPQLWGTQRSAMVVNMQGSSNIELACLDITDHASCIEHHCANGNCPGEVSRCNRETFPWGDWAATGIRATDSARVLVRDVKVHGMANRGISAGRISDWTMERLTIRANGWAGWDGDIGANSSNSGQILFRELELSWNGCGERYPGGQPFGCWAQNAGGYGDGLGTAATAGHWVIEDSIIHHNTSDGIDLLYLTGDARVTVRRSWFEGNAGNQLKTKGSSLIENSVVVGNCAFFNGRDNMLQGDHCRALGNALSVSLFSTSQAQLTNNTIIGQGDCLVLSGGGGSAARLLFNNNLLLGEVDWRQPSERSCLHYSDGGGELAVWSGNFVAGVKGGVCPNGSLCLSSPMISSGTIGAFDPMPLPGSPLLNAATAAAPVDDHRRFLRTVQTPDIGAFEFGAAPSAVSAIFSTGFD